ncbi:Signal transduction histidine kinase [Microbulbifer donghaiensis]|uniref:histidine kinase n=1 Tax=Microbulbifer donghaiensis TaxID=494016 RepID=A0A1M4UHD7_9GAMM|nr:ATP-binding protein [Microbulbifer donghaiensis]SHE56068.1 Signal transduction histidine kinase [Microbulbifer donghaiensis]
MRFRLPHTIRSRTILVLFCAFLLSHTISLAIYEINRDKTILLTEATDLADRIIGVVELARSFPERDRQRILAAAETQFLTMFPEPGNLDDERCRDNDFSRRVTESLGGAFADVPGFHAQVCLRRLKPAPLLARNEPLHGFDVLVAVNFPDNERAVFHAILPEGESLIHDAVLVYLLFSGLIALLLAGYLIRKTVAPLGQLAKAADSIGTNIDTPPLPENGPAEVAAAARAFNRMQQRLARLVHGQTEMLAAISHDLRSAVTRLQLRAELLQDRQEREGLQRVVDDMKTMIQSVLDFARGLDPSETPRRIDLSALAESLCDDLKEEGYPVQFRSGGADCVTECRPVALRRSLHNIIDNAIKYGSEAKVSVEGTAESIRIVVEDCGPGIPMHELEAVLQPFYRLEKSRNSKTGGVGLGLSIAGNTVQAHGGELSLENINGGGLRVQMQLSRC